MSKWASRVHLKVQLPRRRPPGMTRKTIVGTWLSLVERTLGVGEVASSNLVVPTIYFQSVTGGKLPKWVHGFEPGLPRNCPPIQPVVAA
jgi:hypothetical protein